MNNPKFKVGQKVYFLNSEFGEFGLMSVKYDIYKAKVTAIHKFNDKICYSIDNKAESIVDEFGIFKSLDSVKGELVRRIDRNVAITKNNINKVSENDVIKSD
ncbi:hypothetical protein AAEX28_13235 [Lentisphaerota bacterium WC36G]|nr:hypothetical protein LJT99_16065 [Lentisphaerae bacterium WC36]